MNGAIYLILSLERVNRNGRFIYSSSSLFNVNSLAAAV